MDYKHCEAMDACAWLLLFTMLFAATTAWAHGESVPCRADTRKVVF